MAYDIENNADNADDAAKQRVYFSLLLAVVLTVVVFPGSPNTDQLATLLRGHYKPTRSKVTERNRLHSPSQNRNSYRGLCERAEKPFCDDSLCDQFICGLRLNGCYYQITSPLEEP